MSDHARGLASTRQAYDAVASDYARLVPDMTLETPLDRAVLAAFRALLDQLPDLLPDLVVVEVGCGAGRVTHHLAAAGVPMVGLDLSPGMAAVARATYPDLAFGAAHAAALPIRTGAVAGLVAWYSLINLPTQALPAVFAEFARVSVVGAPVVVAFQSGEGQRVERTVSYGRPVPLTYYRHRVEDVAEALAAAGFAEYATVRRAPALAFESTPQAILLARRR